MDRARRLVLLALLLVAVALPARAAERLLVVASFPVLADIVARVGGDRVEVSSLVGPGTQPHAWSPKPQDVRRLAGADLVVVNGLGLEGWLDRLVAASGYEGPVLVASRDATLLHDGSGAPDPHAWHSPVEAGRYAAAIAGALAQRAPEDDAAFRANLTAFQEDLAALAAWAEGEIAAIPAARRVVVTTHDAFAYLGRDLGLRVLSPAGLDSAAQPSARRMAELVAGIRAAGVRAVFLEAGGGGRMARTLAGEAGVEVGAPLYAGTLSGPDGPAPDYAAMWRYNVTLMLDAMQR
jgi:zinc/manganese transport system substrate-binding protein